MSAHDKAAARHARRFTLTVIKMHPEFMQHWDIPNLTEQEVEAEKKHYRECWSHGEYSVDFEVASC